MMYPYALTFFQSPSSSPVVDETLQQLIRSPTTGRVDPERVRKLLRDSSLISGVRRRRVVWDIVKTRKGQKLTGTVIRRTQLSPTWWKIGKSKKRSKA